MRKLHPLSWAALAVYFCLSLQAEAQVPYDESEELWPVEELGVLRARVGNGVLVTLPTDVERVALADETIARPQVISGREVLVTGLEPGRTTVFFWLIDGQRLRYLLQVERDLGLIFQALSDLDSRITVSASPDGSTVVLRGQVSSRRLAREATARATRLLEGQARVLDLLRYPGYSETDEERLEARLRSALRSVDPRITMRRIQVGAEPDPTLDTYVLEGRVRDILALKRAVTVAERQLGGTGSNLKAAGEERLQFQRTRGFFGGASGSGGSGGATGLQAAQPAPAGISAKVARGLVVTSESGRVVSFLEIDLLPQVLVSIRVVEINRTKARKAGINWRFDNEHLSLGSILSPGVAQLPSANPGGANTSTARTPRRQVIRGGPTIVDLGTNIVGGFVDKVTSVMAAVDFLEDKALARAVAEPNVLTLSGEPASVVVGGEVPIPSTATNQVATVQGFFFQDFGVRLDIRPTVVENSLIAIEAAPSIVRRSVGIGVGDVPGFSVQSVSTTARVQAGESLVLGGLLSFEEGLEERKIPGLGWLPGIGRWRRKSRDERELLFIISPRLVETPRSEEPVEPIQMPDLDSVEPPELDWPEDRDSWREEFEPQDMRPDGIPPSFLPEDGSSGTSSRSYQSSSTTTSANDEPELMWEEPAAQPDDDIDANRGPSAAIVDAYPCLNMRAEPQLWSAPIDCVAPDTRVDLIDELEGWRRVRLYDGSEGWMSATYLLPVEEEAVQEEPDSARIDELTHERDALQERADSLEESDAELEKQLEEIQAEIERLQSETQAPPP